MMFAAQNLKLFGGVLQGSVKVETQIVPPMLKQAEAHIDASGPSKILNKLTKGLIKPIKAVGDAIQKVVDSVQSAFNAATSGLRKAQSGLDNASKKCKSA